MEKKVIETKCYDELGERWYTAWDDPVALLRSQSRLLVPLILEKCRMHFAPKVLNVLDVGCGGGLVSNTLAQNGFKVTGLDLSESSLTIARKYDESKTVTYLQGDATEIPFLDNSFDIVTAMDFLEHVSNPKQIIEEMSRVLAPGGLFFFHTFNRNIASNIIVIKLVKWFIKNTPKNLHLHEYFIKPAELMRYCESAKLKNTQLIGIKPKLFSLVSKDIISGSVPKSVEFTTTPSLLISYFGSAEKI